VADSEIRTWLDGHVNLERGVGTPSDRRATAPTLERISELLEWLGSPHHDLRAIHITGTNGKTSTARLCSGLLTELGLKVGLYTSPHLSAVNERIAIGGESIGDADLDEQLDAVRRAEPQLADRLSYFEILTGAALRWFVDEAVDAVVLEVGLGGTWDATNVVDAPVAVVTNIGIDHVEYLGPTREEIAAEKAGIVKPGAHLVLGETDVALQRFFLDRRPAAVDRRDADFGVRANRLAVAGRSVDLFTPAESYDEVFLSLHGAHQGENAAVALAAAEAFVGAPCPEGVVRHALAAASSPGRLEVVGRHPLVVLDGAHNAAGAETLVAALAEEFGDAPRTLVVGLLREKDPTEMLAALEAPRADRLILCPVPSPRGRDPEEIAAAARALGIPDDRVEVCESVKEAIGTAMLETAADGQIVVTGTLYLVGAARSILVGD
jgi:dihydrofolate synthase/folylpolyglutamate synthase